VRGVASENRHAAVRPRRRRESAGPGRVETVRDALVERGERPTQPAAVAADAHKAAWLCSLRELILEVGCSLTAFVEALMRVCREDELPAGLLRKAAPRAREVDEYRAARLQQEALELVCIPAGSRWL
jgi:hypothetical protein